MWRQQTTIELGVARCVAVTAPDGQSAPTCEQRQTDAWSLVLDARLVRQAAACCPQLRDVLVLSSVVNPSGPQGGCAGVTMQMSVEV